MSKLNRKEFKELLSEWKNNFINERVSQSLRHHIKGKIRDFVIVQIKESKPLFKNALDKNNINFSFVGNIVLSCSKEQNIKDFILNNFNLDEENKILLEMYYNQKYPILVSSGTFSGQFSEENMHTKEDCLNWLIHDLYHSIFDIGSRGQSDFLDVVNSESAKEIISNYEKILPDLNYNFENFDMHNLMDYDEEYTSDILTTGQYKQHIIPEILNYFKSINFTVGIESFDLMPSIFSYCLIKMPNPEDVQGLDSLFKSTNLSDEAKVYLLIFNSIAEQNFDNIVLSRLENKILFMDLSL